MNPIFKDSTVFLDSEYNINAKQLLEWKKKGCKKIVSLTSGLDHVDLETAKRLGITIENRIGLNAASTAEWATWQLLNWARKNREYGIELANKNITIIGFGSIGQKIASILNGMHCKLFVYDKEPKLCSWVRYSTNLYVLELWLPQSDIVFLCLPLTKQTKGFFGRKLLNACKKNVVLINIGRDELVKEEFLTYRQTYIRDSKHVAWKTREVLERKRKEIEGGNE